MPSAPQFVCDSPGETENPATTYPPVPDIFSSAEIPFPTERPLAVFAFDPSAGRYVGNHMTTSLRYEILKPGPIGDRFAVVDYDGGNKTFYKPVDLDDPKLLIKGGLPPTESDPRFHQQMVYAVANETLQRFEYALGRRIRWRGVRRSPTASAIPRGASRRLNLYPHAMYQSNAFYSPEARGILFGYFAAARTQQGRNLPGQTVFTCLSHDIIAHEVTHAIVDGIRQYFMEPTNIDVAAFHEAFADLAALFSHFAHKEALIETLQKTGGRLFDFKLKPDPLFQGDPRGSVIQAQLSADNPLIALAMQFGEASGKRGGLRSALGTRPNSDDIQKKTEAHDRGSILVAAVFDAYFTIYTRRTFDLFRIFRAGGGLITQSDLPTPLANRLATEASRTADEFFVICARALDYCPPVDITFGDFLRAVLTAHLDLHPDDPDGLRDALMEAFQLRGIYPDGATSFSEEFSVLAQSRAGQAPARQRACLRRSQWVDERREGSKRRCPSRLRQSECRSSWLRPKRRSHFRPFVSSHVSPIEGRQPVCEHGGRVGSDRPRLFRWGRLRNLSVAQWRHPPDFSGPLPGRCAARPADSVCDYETAYLRARRAHPQLLLCDRASDKQGDRRRPDLAARSR